MREKAVAMFEALGYKVENNSLTFFRATQILKSGDMIDLCVFPLKGTVRKEVLDCKGRYPEDLTFAEIRALNTLIDYVEGNE